MTRQTISGGGWFDTDKATKYEEDSRWNGNNHISCATGSQWEHETLYRTRSGAWVLHNWAASGENWDIIGTDSAAEWLVAQRHGDTPLDRGTTAAIAQAEV